MLAIDDDSNKKNFVADKSLAFMPFLRRMTLGGSACIQGVTNSLMYISTL